MHSKVDDVRIAQIKPLIPPAILMEEIPLPDPASQLVAQSRRTIEDIIAGKDDRSDQ